MLLGNAQSIEKNSLKFNNEIQKNRDQRSLSHLKSQDLELSALVTITLTLYEVFKILSLLPLTLFGDIVTSKSMPLKIPLFQYQILRATNELYLNF